MFTSNLAHANLERQLVSAQTTRMELETKLREREIQVERLERDRRWLADREQEEKEERERARREYDEDKVRRHFCFGRIPLMVDPPNPSINSKPTSGRCVLPYPPSVKSMPTCWTPTRPSPTRTPSPLPPTMLSSPLSPHKPPTSSLLSPSHVRSQKTVCRPSQSCILSLTR